MKSSAAHLYQQTVIDHNKEPHNCRKILNPTHQAEGYNPKCGDQLNVYVDVSDNMISDVSFEGDCCAVCRASASLMTELLKAKTLEQFDSLFDQFNRLISKELDPLTQAHDLNDVSVFQGIWDFPSRIQCANLPWYTCKSALNHQSNTSTELSP